MSLLNRYLLRSNIVILFAILSAGVGIYLLTDMLERLDHFFEADVPFSTAMLYFAIKIPLIISQILPAVFLIALIVQLSLMIKNKELLALQAGGISPLRLIRFVIVYGIFWGCIQLGFSQGLGVKGEEIANNIWREQVRGNAPDHITLQGIWFTEGMYVIHLTTVQPLQGTGTGFLAYKLNPDGLTIEELLRAESFSTTGNSLWLLTNVEKVTPANFMLETSPNMTLQLKQDLESFQIAAIAKPSQLSLWHLSDAIKRLERSGSNVEALQTAWHAKLAYASSLVVMGLLALCLVFWTPNIYISVGMGLVCTFLFHALVTIAGTLGSKGFVTPIIAAWAPDILISSLAVARLIYVHKRRT